MRLGDADAIRTIKYWAGILGIDPIYQFKVKVNNAPDPDVKVKDRKDIQATVSVDQSYFSIRITINAYEFEASELDGVVIHELIHVVLAPLDSIVTASLGPLSEHATNLCEAATERLTQAFVKLAKAKKGMK
jgi:hypothetical protein